ncbi:MAG TPA: hypothetical protein EYQ14_02715 [Gammaproteobacteria bacterium]|nr:hypothetical protein [Gammaproteobacteria bacterium]HIL94912.1 hypothetical protein [Pseudomonadales bacterium]
MNSTLPSHLRGDYQIQDSGMTLREGLAEYYQVNPGLSDPNTIEDPVSAAYFRNHDASHVFFGTHTGVLNEAINDLLTLWGVDVPYKDYITGFTATQESKSILKQLLNISIIVTLWQTIRLIPAVRRNAKAMTRRWPWAPPDDYYERPLCDLRTEFGYQVLCPQQSLGVDD